MEVKINALPGLTKVAFMERWPSYRVVTIDRFHCTYIRYTYFSAQYIYKLTMYSSVVS